MKRWVLIWLLGICALAVPGATARSSNSILVGFGSLAGHQPVATIQVPVQTSGQLTVSFHGDPATGCAGQGICGYSGTVVFAPGTQAAIAVAKYAIHGRVSYQAALSLPAGVGDTFTGAQVRRAEGGTCSDADQPNASLPGTVTGDQVAIGLIQPQGGLFSTRCAGPLDADLTGQGPQLRLTLGQLLRGRRTIPLSGTWSFAAGGFAGTIESNLTMILGEPSVERTSSQVPKVFQRDRQVVETLTLVRGTGSLTLALGGDPGTCQFLDSCGVEGALTGRFAPQGATASLFVLGPARRPFTDFLAALGLSRRGNPRGLELAGTLDWPTGGTLTAQLEQGAACTSTAPLSGGLVVFGSSSRGVSAEYSPIDSPRTRCPGPELEQFQPLASGSVLRTMLGRPSFSLHLEGSGPLSDDGYTIRQHTGLTLTLKRGGVHQFFFRVPTP